MGCIPTVLVIHELFAGASGTLNGQVANEIPYGDEEFYWTRELAACHLNAGWNKVLLRIPCGYGGQEWSFTFIPVKQQPPGTRWVEDESVRFSAELK